MRKTKYHLLLLIVFSLWNCTTEIDVAVPYAGPSLVVEALLDWDKNGTGNRQSIQLSILNRYNEFNSLVPALEASVRVVNLSAGTSFEFIDQGGGLHITSDFEPVLGDNYRLEIRYDDEYYEAEERMMSTPDIDTVYQSMDRGLDQNLLEVHMEFKDQMNTEDYYLVAFCQGDSVIPVYRQNTDEFREGSVYDVIYEKGDLGENNGFKIGEQVEIKFRGISKQYFDYLDILLNQYDVRPTFGNAFENARGNCINLTNPNNYALGYFSLSQVDTASYFFK